MRLDDASTNADSFDSVRRGLVLSGGGAKGAYAFGCLLALKERGVKFDVVSGTSVGALNGVLWSTDQLGQGEELWEQLSFASVYPANIFRHLPRKLLWIASFAFVALRMALSYLFGSRIPSKSSWIFGVLWAMPFWLPFLLAPMGKLFASATENTRHFFATEAVGVTIFAAAFLAIRSQRDFGRMVYFTMTGLGLFFGIVSLMDDSRALGLSDWWLLAWTASMCSIAVFAGTGLALNSRLFRFATALSSTPLNEHLARIISSSGTDRAHR